MDRSDGKMELSLLRLAWCGYGDLRAPSPANDDSDDYDDDASVSHVGGVGGGVGYSPHQHGLGLATPSVGQLSPGNGTGPSAMLRTPITMALGNQSLRDGVLLQLPTLEGGSPAAAAHHHPQRQAGESPQARTPQPSLGMSIHGGRVKQPPRLALHVWPTVKCNFSPTSSLSLEGVDRDGIVATVDRIAGESLASFRLLLPPTFGGGSPTSAAMASPPAHIVSGLPSMMIRNLDLTGCGLGDRGLVALSETLASGKERFALLETITLHFNGITDSGAGVVAALIHSMENDHVAEKQRRVMAETARVMKQQGRPPPPALLAAAGKNTSSGSVAGDGSIRFGDSFGAKASPRKAADAWSRARVAVLDAKVRSAMDSSPQHSGSGNHNTHGGGHHSGTPSAASSPFTTLHSNMMLPSLRLLRLTDNDITDEGAGTIAAALLDTTVLELDVDLEGNDVSPSDGHTWTLASSLNRARAAATWK